MQAFAAELRALARKYELAKLEGRDFYRNGRHGCEFRKNIKHDTEGRWTICTHSDLDESPYTFACTIDYCPIVSQGIRQAYEVRAKEREERR